jgi:hypothetical protein
MVFATVFIILNSERIWKIMFSEQGRLNWIICICTVVRRCLFFTHSLFIKRLYGPDFISFEQ